ncbi:MAG: membrane dipeptidase, partial [Bacteroidota bacterium]
MDSTTTNGRRGFLKRSAGFIAAAPFLNLNAYSLSPYNNRTYSREVLDIVKESLIIDMLGLLDMTKFFMGTAMKKDPFDFSEKELLAIKKSGINVFHHAVGLGGKGVKENALTYLGALNGLAAEHPDHILRIDSAEDFDRVMAENKIGVMLGIQNADHFEEPEDVNTCYLLGQRVSQLTYNTQNLIGSGSTDRVDGGVSDFGERIIKKMNEVGMAVDVSHCGDQTTLDAFEISDQPVLITHSNCRSLAGNHPRCKTDDAIKKMAKQGGVMGITAVRNFVKADEPTTLDHYIDHIQHVVKLTSLDHVGIGTDADLSGYDDLPGPIYKALKAGYKSSYGFREKIDIEGMDHPQKMYDLCEGLLKRGYNADNIKQIFGTNF